MPRVNPRTRPTGGLMDRPSPAVIFLRRQKRLLRPALGGCMLLGLVGGGVWFAHLMNDEARFAPLRAELGAKAALHVAKIEIYGRDMTPESSVLQALGVSVGDDILGFSVEEARKRLDALTFVEHSTVERRLPGTIVVHLQERRPYAVWQNQGRFVLIDRNGQVVADQGMNGKDAEAFAQLPLVVGAGAPQAAEGLIEALAAQPDVRTHVVAAVRVGMRRWNLTLRNGCDVLLPEGAETQALARLAQLQHDHQLLVRPLEAIDMRLPDRLVIRPRPAPAPDPDAADGTATDAQAADTGADHPATARPASTVTRKARPAPSHSAVGSGPQHGDNGDTGADSLPDGGADQAPDSGRRPA